MADAPASARQDVPNRRSREIAGYLSSARQAFVARNYDATLLACEKALLLDPQNVEALDLLDLARTTTDEQRIEQWLTEAQQSLDRRDINSASDLIDQALALDPNLEAALALRKRMLALRRERDRGRDRARILAGAADRARVRLNEQNFDSAVRHSDDALRLDRQSTEAREIRSTAAASLYGRSRARVDEAGSGVSSPAVVRPGIWSFRRYGGVAASGGLLLLAGIWFWIYLLGSRATPPPQPGQAASTPAGPSPAAATEPVPAPAPPVSTVAVETPTAAAPPRAPAGETPSRQAAKQRPIRASEKPRTPPAESSKSTESPEPSTAKPPATGPPPAPQPAQAPPDSQPSASDLEKARVAGIVYRYAAGYSTLNAAAVYAVFPGEAVWQFPEFDFYVLKVDDLATELSPDGLSATVVCTATHTFKRKRVTAPVSERLRQTFSLRKRGAGWIIASIGYDRTGR